MNSQRNWRTSKATINNRVWCAENAFYFVNLSLTMLRTHFCCCNADVVYLNEREKLKKLLRKLLAPMLGLNSEQVFAYKD